MTKQVFIEKKYGKPMHEASSNNILTVGYFHEKQGIDLLVKAFSMLKRDRRFEDVKLFLVGRGYPKKYASKDVILTGFVPDLSLIYRKCGLYVHAGRFQAFPVSVLEAMHYGLPVIVTNMTGVCDILEAKFVSKTNPRDIASKMRMVLSQSRSERLFLGEKNYRISLEFVEEKKVREFVKAFNTLLRWTSKKKEKLKSRIKLLPSYALFSLIWSVWMTPIIMRKVHQRVTGRGIHSP